MEVWWLVSSSFVREYFTRCLGSFSNKTLDGCIRVKRQRLAEQLCAWIHPRGLGDDSGAAKAALLFFLAPCGLEAGGWKFSMAAARRKRRTSRFLVLDCVGAFCAYMGHAT